MLFLPKSFRQSQKVTRKSCGIIFRMKNAYVKYWWNRHQVWKLVYPNKFTTVSITIATVCIRALEIWWFRIWLKPILCNDHATTRRPKIIRFTSLTMLIRHLRFRAAFATTSQPKQQQQQQHQQQWQGNIINISNSNNGK